MNEEGSERGRKLRVGIFVLVGVAAFLGMVYALGARARLFEPRFTIHADFTEVGGLVEGATVRLAGVQIGRVSAVNLPPQPGGNGKRRELPMVAAPSTARAPSTGCRMADSMLG